MVIHWSLARGVYGWFCNIFNWIIKFLLSILLSNCLNLVTALWLYKRVFSGNTQNIKGLKRCDVCSPMMYAAYSQMVLKINVCEHTHT